MNKLTRTQKETFVIIAVAIVAVLLIVGIMWNQDTTVAASATSGNVYKHGVYSPQPAIMAHDSTALRHISEPGIIERWESCHTYSVGPVFGGVENTWAQGCENVTTVTVTSEQTPANSEQSTVTSEQVTVVTETPIKEDKPAVIQPVKVKKNNGNHYGNNKPDNNGKDVKNVHNGEQTYNDHHDNNGNSEHGNNGNNEHGNGNGGH